MLSRMSLSSLRRRALASCAFLLFASTVHALGACSSTDTNAPTYTSPPTKDAGGSSGSSGDDDATSSSGADGSPSTHDSGPNPHPDAGSSNLRVVAANISSGQASTYDSGEGIRIFQGLHPDVALIQELNYGTNSDADMASFVTTAFGANYTHYREPGLQIPNGIVSRYPIEASGHWTDPSVSNRGFAWAKIQVPGTHPLWAVSVHLLTSGAANRKTEATALVGELNKVVQAGDYIVIGGDFNTDNRTEECITTFAAIVSTSGPYPVDQQNNDFTSGPRSRPYDWVLPSPNLAGVQVPTVIGANAFPAGLVFDSRVYTPLTDVSPVLKDDSGSVNMQHMPVIKDFAVP